MKFEIIDNLTFNVYISKKNIKLLDTNNKEEMEKLLKKLLNKIKHRYSINIEGFYNVKAYIDKHYGIIFNIKKEELNYYEYFNGQIDINMKMVKSSFLYKLDYIPFNLLAKISKKVINNDVFFEIKKELNLKEEMCLIEHTEKILKV